MLFTHQNNEWVHDQVTYLKHEIKSRCGTNVEIIISQALPDLTPKAIIEVLCASLNVTKKALFHMRKGKQEIVFARYIGMELVRKHTAIKSPSAIGKLFNRKRTTVIHALKQTHNMMETGYETFIMQYYKVEQALYARINQAA